MNETSDNSVVTARQVTRLRGLVVASLCLNGLILLLILLGAICHHHRHHHGQMHAFGAWGGKGGCPVGGSCGFHHHPPVMGRGGWAQPFRGAGSPGNQGGKDFGPHMGVPADPSLITDVILAHLAQQLTLTDDQKAKIKPILSAQVAQFQKEEEAQRQARQKEMQENRAKMRPLLNAEQQQLLDQLPMPGEKAAMPSEAPNH